MAALVKYAVSTAGVTPHLLKRKERLRGSRRTLPELSVAAAGVRI
jgi:hypothetical protein